MFENLLQIMRQGDNELVALVCLTLLVLILIIGWLILIVKTGRMNRRLTALTRGVDGGNLEAALKSHLDRVEETIQRMESLEQAVAILQAQIPGCLQQVNVVRFDAFDDVGGEQSFAIALLDGQKNGVILSSLYSRQDNRMYAKAVRSGSASQALSDEEQRALNPTRG